MARRRNPCRLLIGEFRRNLDTLSSVDERVLVACSGGPDSICLLHLLTRCRPARNLMAVYVNHGLRPDEAQNEERLVQDFCRSCQIGFQAVSVNVPALATSRKMSIEDAARILRYQKLEEIREQAGFDKIALGHTADDQTENFFIKLIRGTNCAGLAGIKPASGKLIRPLLGQPKKTLLVYLEATGISYCHDSSNDDQRFLRNKIRRRLLPQLKTEYNPSIDEKIRQIGIILTRENDLLEQLTNQAMQELVIYAEKEEIIKLSQAKLLDLHPALQGRVIEKSCWLMATKPSFRTIEAVLKLAESGSHAGELHLGKGLRVVKSRRWLTFFHPFGKTGHRQASSQPIKVDVQIPKTGRYQIAELGKELVLVHTKNINDENALVVDAGKLDFPLRLRSVRPGERFTPPGFNGSKKINRYLAEKKINFFEKYKYPVLSSKEKIICIPGLIIDDQARPSSKDLLLIYWQDI
ncbi:MAG: tRNA lysidine(34) synthetase TilS [Deltaproteobacteria bacterium]|nr:MAG: tRNA lysidine(34) synthetase TilS [Deltaproteobacteria bacterium]